MTAFCRCRTWCTAILLVLVTASCDDAVAPEGAGARASGDAMSQLGRADGEVAVPFTARYFTDLAALIPDARCGDFPNMLNVQEGWGEATHLGRFAVRITFCIDITDVLDGALTEGESLPYSDGEGTLTAANGDELHIAIAGAVVPSTDPAFDFEFSDPFQFTGGTGRFAGAGGSGMTSSFVNFQSDPSRTTHVWSGTLVLPR